MKDRHPNVRPWVALLVCLITVACVKSLDVSKVRCTQSANCPSGYICSPSGKCVSGAINTDGGRADLNPSGNGGDSGGFEASSGGAGGASKDANGSGGLDVSFAGSGGTGDVGGDVDAPLDVPITPGCESGQHLCGGKCVRNDDISSCGVACSACPVPQNGTATCDGTSCGGSCPMGKTLCNGTCIDNTAACSGTCPTGTHACNNFCLANNDITGCGPSCTVCSVPAGASQATCDGTKCGFVCSSGYHACGGTCARDDSPSACGTSCASCPTDPNGAAACVAGACAITCSSGYHYCSGTGKCLKDTDPGSCGTSCTPCPSITGGTATCSSGVCAGTCPGTQKLCNGACVDSTAACGNQCSTGSHNCSGVCSPDTSPNSCGIQCTPCPTPAGAASNGCSAGGTCTFTCGTAHHQCGSACPTDDDATACGAQCVRCSADAHGTAICQNGTCSVRCDSGWHNCSGVCVSNSALETCGLNECTTACVKPVGGTVSCNGTACAPACPSSLPQNCNGTCIAQNAACNGTCPAGQRTCSGGNTCINIAAPACCQPGECSATGAHTVATCTNNTCGSTCATGYSQCTSGCVDLTSDSSNCQACGNACTGGRTCSNSTCSCAASGQAYCGGACVDILSSSAHCGASCSPCGSPNPKCSSGSCVQCTVAGDCSGGRTCTSNQCVCPGSLADCGSSGCINIHGSDNSNCGACGNKCGANRTCSNGSCACTGYTLSAACGSTCGSWSFESGTGSTEGWSVMMSPTSAGQPSNGATNAVISSSRPASYPGTGSYSLVVPLAISASGTWVGGVGVVICPGAAISVGGYTLTGYVYFDGPTFPDYAVFEAMTWTGTDSSTDAQHIIMSQAGSGTIAIRTWIPFTRTFQAGYLADRFALQVAPNGPWNGTMYLDDIKITGL